MQAACWLVIAAFKVSFSAWLIKQLISIIIIIIIILIVALSVGQACATCTRWQCTGLLSAASRFGPHAMLPKLVMFQFSVVYQLQHLYSATFEDMPSDLCLKLYLSMSMIFNSPWPFRIASQVAHQDHAARGIIVPASDHLYRDGVFPSHSQASQSLNQVLHYQFEERSSDLRS